MEKDSQIKGKGKADYRNGKLLVIDHRSHADIPEACKPKEIDVLIYERSVEVAFQNQIEKYALFNQIFDDFIIDRVSGDDTIRKMNILFEEHEKLRVGCKRFLSLKYELITGEKRVHPHNNLDGREFLARVKEHFRGDPIKYHTFIDILSKSYTDNNVNAVEVYTTINMLFGDHADLLRNCRKYFPHKIWERYMF